MSYPKTKLQCLRCGPLYFLIRHLKTALGISIRFFLAISIFAIIEIDLLVSSVFNYFIMRSRDLLETIKTSCFVDGRSVLLRLAYPHQHKLVIFYANLLVEEYILSSWGDSV